MLGVHRLRGTWTGDVDGYLAPSRFCRDYFVAAGLPAAKVHLKPNFLARDPGQRSQPGDYALFVGRLSAEKGVLEMVEAWSQLPRLSLRVVGDGPLSGAVRRLAERSKRNVTPLGALDVEQTLAQIKHARFLIFPSRWDEPFGMVLLEAAACGVPAIATRVGAVPELVADHQTGLLFDPDDFGELVERVQWAAAHPAEMEEMGRAARQLYCRKFTAEKNYQMLMSVYSAVLKNWN